MVCGIVAIDAVQLYGVLYSLFQLFAMKRIEANQSLIWWIFALIREFSYTYKSSLQLALIRFEIFASTRSKSKRRNNLFSSLRSASKYSVPFMSMLLVRVYAARLLVHSACLYCMSMSILLVHVHTVFPRLCNMSMSMVHVQVRAAVHVHAASQCPCYKSMSVLYVHVHAAGI
jgi:hypothetical protein